MSVEPDKSAGCPIECDKCSVESGDSVNSGDNVAKEEKKKAGRSVHFPEEEQIVTQYFEPANPWHDVASTTRSQLAAEYLDACRRHNTICIDSVLEQIRELPEASIGGVLRAPRLTLAECQLLGTAPADALEAVLRKVQFRRVDIDHALIDDEGAEAIFDMIEYYESACTVSITGPRQFGIRGWQAASRMIKKSAELSELEISDSPLEAAHSPVLARSLRPLTCRLRSLSLQTVELAGEPLLNLVIALKSNSSVRELRLCDNNLSVTDCSQLASLLKYNNRIQLLDLSNNQIQDAGVSHIAEALSQQASQSPSSAAASPLSPHRCHGVSHESRGLTFLVLWNNQLTRNCAPHISKALRSCPTLCVLNIGRNAVGSDVVRACSASSLVSLGLQAARLGPDAAIPLAELIMHSTCLQRLDLRENRLGSVGLQAILAAMKENTTLTQIDLDEPPECTSLLAEESETGLIRRATRDVRALCGRNEPTSSSVHHAAHRKISLTCHTATLLTGIGVEEERRVGRLRSPAPSPAPSPAGSPVPAQHHNSRFSVTRVTPERDSSSDSRPSTPTRPTYCQQPSRFKVMQVMEPPQIQVHPAASPRKSPSRFSVTRNYDTMYNPSPPASPACNMSSDTNNKPTVTLTDDIINIHTDKEIKKENKHINEENQVIVEKNILIDIEDETKEIIEGTGDTKVIETVLPVKVYSGFNKEIVTSENEDIIKMLAGIEEIKVPKIDIEHSNIDNTIKSIDTNEILTNKHDCKTDEVLPVKLDNEKAVLPSKINKTTVLPSNNERNQTVIDTNKDKMVQISDVHISNKVELEDNSDMKTKSEKLKDFCKHVPKIHKEIYEDVLKELKIERTHLGNDKNKLKFDNIKSEGKELAIQSLDDKILPETESITEIEENISKETTVLDVSITEIVVKTDPIIDKNEIELKHEVIETKQASVEATSSKYSIDTPVPDNITKSDTDLNKTELEKVKIEKSAKEDVLSSLNSEIIKLNPENKSDNDANVVVTIDKIDVSDINNVRDSFKNVTSDLKYSEVVKTNVDKNNTMKQIVAITEDLGNIIKEMRILVKDNSDMPKKDVVLKKNKSESSLDSPDLEVSRLTEKMSSVFDSSSSLEISGSSMESLNEHNRTIQELDRRKTAVILSGSSVESDVTPVISNLLNLSLSSNDSVSPIFGKTKQIHDSLSSLEASVSSLDSGKHEKLMVTSADSGIEYSLQNPAENKEDNSSNEGTLTNYSSLKETVKKSENFLDNLTVSPKRASSLLDVPALKNKGLDRMRKISWVPPSSSFQIPKPEEKETKPSHLEKLLSLFQHPSSIFSRNYTSDDEKKSTSSTPPRKDSSLTSSFWTWGSTIEKDREEDSSEATDSTLSERVQVSFVDESFSRKLDSKTPSTDTDNTLSEFQSFPQESECEKEKVTVTTEDIIVQKLDVSVNSKAIDVARNGAVDLVNEKEYVNLEQKEEIARPRSFAAVLKSSGSENTIEKQNSPDSGQSIDKLPSKVIRGIKENISPENTLTSSMTNTKTLAEELERQVKNPVPQDVLKKEFKREDVKIPLELAPIATIEETDDLPQLAYIDDVKVEDISEDIDKNIDLGKDALSYLMFENKDSEIKQDSLEQELKDAAKKEIIDLSPELVIDEGISQTVFTAKENKGLRTSPIIPERAKIKKSNSLEDLSHIEVEKSSPKAKTIAFKVPESTTPRDIPERRTKLRTRSGSSPKSLPDSLNKPCPLSKMDSVLSKKKKKVSSLGKMARDSLLALNMTEEEIADFRRSYKLTSVESLKSLESVSEDANSQSGNSIDSRCRACLRTSQESIMSLDSITEDCRCREDSERPGRSAR